MNGGEKKANVSRIRNQCFPKIIRQIKLETGVTATNRVIRQFEQLIFVRLQTIYQKKKNLYAFWRIFQFYKTLQPKGIRRKDNTSFLKFHY